MGSTAHPGVARAQALLAQIERLSRESAAKSGEVDCSVLAQLLDEALDSLAGRQMLLVYLATYLSRCVSGAVPDYRDWLPPIL